MTKKLSIIMLITAMLISIFSIAPLTASAATSGTCGSALTWSYSSSSGVLTINGSGEMEKYALSSNVSTAPWYEHRAGIKAIKISSGVTTIGSYAFRGLYALTTVTLPDTLTTIGGEAFRACSALTSITIPENVTLIENSAFYACTSLKSVIYSAKKCQTMAYENRFPVFLGCSSLTTITVTDGVESLPPYAFMYASDATSIELPSTLKTIGEYAFAYCSSLKTIELPENLSEIGASAFQNDSRLQTVKFNNKLYKIGDSAFKNCTLLENMSLPPLISSVGSYAFANSAITSIEFTDTVTFIGINAFDGNDDITFYAPEYSYAYYYANTYGYTIEITRYAGTGSGDSGSDSGIITTSSTIYTINETVVVFTEFSRNISSNTLHMALYDDNGKLVNYIMVPILKAMDHTNVVFKDEGTATTAKIFIWNQLIQCTPLNTAETVAITRG